MALLCTLHADGPATLKRLRQAGCATLEAFEALDPDRAAAVIDATPASARRLQREARGLRERLTGELATAHASPVSIEPPPPFPAVPSPSSARTPIAHEAPVARDAAAATPEPALADLEARERRIVQRVLETWRRKDAEDAEESDGIGAKDEPPELARTSGDDGTPRDETIEHGTPLTPRVLDGLDADLCVELASRGVHTLEALAAADPVELVRALPIGYSRLARLTALARRALPAEAHAPRATEKISRSERARSTADDDAASEIADELKPTPPRAPKTRPTRLEAEREGAGGPFV